MALLLLPCTGCCGTSVTAQEVVSPVSDVASRYDVTLPLPDLAQLTPEDRDIVLLLIRTTLTEQQVRTYGVYFDESGTSIVVVAGDQARARIQTLLAPMFVGAAPVVVDHPGPRPAAVELILAHQVLPPLLNEGGTIEHERVWSAILTGAAQAGCALDLDSGTHSSTHDGRHREIRSRDRAAESALAAGGGNRVYRSHVRIQLSDESVIQRESPVGNAVQVSVDHHLWWRRQSDTQWHELPSSETPIGPRSERTAAPTVRGCITALTRAVRRP